jgi:hypothetical protein
MSAEPTLPTLMTKLAAAEQRGTDDTDTDEILALMQTAAALPGGLEQLVERFAGSPVDVLARTLAFLLARSVSSSDTPGAVAPLVWSAVSALSTDDESARVNLLSAIQLLGARSAFPSMAEPVPAGLGAFLIDVLQRGEEVLDAAGPALLSLDAHGFLERLNRSQLQTIQEILKQMAEPNNPFARADMAVLRDRLGAH